MKSKRELNSLYGLYVACEGAMSYCYQLQKYEQNNPLVLDSKKKIHITSECYTKVSNIVTAVKKIKIYFRRQQMSWHFWLSMLVVLLMFRTI